jgi:hypothetical protein
VTICVPGNRLGTVMANGSDTKTAQHMLVRWFKCMCRECIGNALGLLWRVCQEAFAWVAAPSDHLTCQPRLALRFIRMQIGLP